MIGNVGENASLRRALCFKTPSPLFVSGYTHPTQTNEIQPAGIPLIGKYGAIVAFECQNSDTQPPLNIQRNICQHIVGMKPIKIGVIDVDEPNEVKDDEVCLIHQEYLLDPDVVVKDILIENNLKVIDFQRFECGENLEEQSLSDIAKKAVN